MDDRHHRKKHRSVRCTQSVSSGNEMTSSQNNYSVTPPKFNMEPVNGAFQKEFRFQALFEKVPC